MVVQKVPTSKLTSFLLALGLMTTLAGTSEAKNKEDAVELSNSNFSGEVDSGNQTVNISGSNSVVTVAGVPSTLNVDGSNNEAKVPGGCPFVFVSGSNNRVILGLAKKIILEGSNNTIYWSKTATGRPPEVSNRGSNNKISLRREPSSLETNPVSKGVSTTSVTQVETNSNSSQASSSVQVGPGGIFIKTTDGANIPMR